VGRVPHRIHQERDRPAVHCLAEHVGRLDLLQNGSLPEQGEQGAFRRLGHPGAPILRRLAHGRVRVRQEPDQGGRGCRVADLPQDLAGVIPHEGRPVHQGGPHQAERLRRSHRPERAHGGGARFRSPLPEEIPQGGDRVPAEPRQRFDRGVPYGGSRAFDPCQQQPEGSFPRKCATARIAWTCTEGSGSASPPWMEGAAEATSSCCRMKRAPRRTAGSGSRTARTTLRTAGVPMWIRAPLASHRVPSFPRAGIRRSTAGSPISTRRRIAWLRTESSGPAGTGR